MLAQLIYYSKNDPTVDLKEITKIMKESNQKNDLHSITGVLYHDENYFLQLLEGDLHDVNALYLRIAQDIRHREPVIIDVSSIDSRKFGQWNMLYVDSSTIEDQELERYFPDRNFIPTSIPVHKLIDFTIGIRKKEGK